RTKINQWQVTDWPISSAATELIELIYQDAENDLDTTRTLQRLRSLERDEDFSDADKAAIFLRADAILGLDLNRKPVEVELTSAQKELLEQRFAARAAKNFALSDQLRDELIGIGIRVSDTADGQSWEVNN
ncbi:MAG: cysteine--tRNA ligase, partial [Actinomycetes bacterium]